MQYFVIGPDGSRYGPADLNLLRQWVVEGRLAPDTQLEDTATMQRMPASSVGDLFPQAPVAPPYVGSPYIPTSGVDPSQPSPMPEFGSQYMRPPTPAQYPRYAGGGQSSTNSTLAWVFFVLAIVLCWFCPIFAGLGFWQATLAQKRGDYGAQTVKICNLVLLILGGSIWLLYILSIAVFSVN